MKKALLIGIAMLFAASAVSAAPAVPYIGLFSDVTPGHSVCSYTGTASSRVIYVWVLPDVNGCFGAEFKILTSDVDLVTLGSPTFPAFVPVSNGTLDAGISLTFNACQYDWVWIVSFRVYLDSGGMVANVQIVPDPTSIPPTLSLLQCLPLYPMVTPIRLTNFYFNSPCVYATKDASWGAIKSLF